MAGKRNYEWPLATEWDAAAFFTQDKSGGVTQRVSSALVETKLEADGFPKIPSPSANEVAVYGVGGWDSVKLADANIDAAAAIGWGKISKAGAVASDVGAEPALGNPGPGTWFLKTISGVRSWVASIPWAGVDKTGAVASDVGALDVAPIQAAGQLSGFADKDNITQVYNQSENTVTTSHPSGTIVMYWRGARITKASPWTTEEHPPTISRNYFYSSSDGVNFGWSTVQWQFSDIQVAMIRFGTSLKIPIRECHGLMDPDSHEEFHAKIWTYIKSGGTLTAGTYALRVADDASITPGVDACVLRDEDLSTNLDALPQGAYTVCTPNGTEFDGWSLARPFFHQPSGYIQYYPSDAAVQGANNKYYNVYRVGVPTMEPSNPLRWLWITPQAQYDSFALASAESFTSLRLGDLALGTSEYCPVERIVYKSGAAYASTGKVRIEAIQPLERVAGVVSSVGASVLSGSGVAGEPTYWASPSSLASETAANFRTRIAALPVADPTATGTLTAPDVIGGLARIQASAVSPSNQAWFGYTGLNSAGAYVGYYPGSDGAVRIAAASGETVSIGTGAAYGQLVISDSGVASSSLGGTGTRAVAADSTGKLVVSPGSEEMVLSDFGRIGSGGLWQSAFTDNTSASLRLLANSVTNGTHIRIDQEMEVPFDSGAQYQFALGPYLPPGTGPSVPQYVEAINMADGKYGQGRLEIEVEFIGSGASMVAYVTSTQFRRSGSPFQPITYTGSIPFDATIENWIDIQFNPSSLPGSDYIIRRNRVYRVSP